MTLKELLIVNNLKPEEFSMKELKDIKWLLSVADKPKYERFAHMKLTRQYGFGCDGKWCGCNGFSAAEIRGERETVNN